VRLDILPPDVEFLKLSFEHLDKIASIRIQFDREKISKIPENNGFLRISANETLCMVTDVLLNCQIQPHDSIVTVTTATDKTKNNGTLTLRASILPTNNRSHSKIIAQSALNLSDLIAASNKEQNIRLTVSEHYQLNHIKSAYPHSDEKIGSRAITRISMHLAET
jgi:hypothetical protein